MANCADIIREATGLSDRDIGRVLRDLQQEVVRRGGSADPQVVFRAAKEKMEKAARAAAKMERDVKLGEVRLADQFGKLGDYNTRFRGIKAALSGSNADTGTARFSTEARAKAQAGDVLEHFFKDIDANGHELLSRGMHDKGLNLDTVRELWAFTDNATTTSVTGNKEAFHAAQVMDKHNEIVRTLANNAGAEIERLPGHQSVQVHNARRITNAGYDDWSKKIIDRLDQQKTFGGQDADKVLKAIYRKIEDDRLGSFTGIPGQTLADRMNEGRFLIFKTADDWLAYDAEFGRGDGLAIPAFMDNLMRRAHEVAILEDWGPDPDKTFKKLMAKAVKTDTGPAKDRLGAIGAQRLEAEWRALTMQDRSPANPNFAAFMSGTRKWVSATKLGAAVVSSFSDLVTRVVEAQYNGSGVLDSYANAFRGPSKDPRVARLVKTFSEGFLSSLHGRMTAEDGIPGRMSKMSNVFYKMNLLSPWTDYHKGGFATMLAHDLSNYVKHGWSEIPEMLQKNLSRYGIDEAAWKVIQDAGVGEFDGSGFVTPDMIQDRDVRLKLRAWFMTEVDHAVPSTGVQERAVTLWGTQPGTPLGEAARSIAQFKMFPVATMMRTLPRVKQMGAPGMIQYAVGAMAMGYVSMMAKAALRGETPPDPRNLKVIAGAFTTSGGLGIMGDLLITDFTATGRSFAEVISGPVIGGMAGDAARLWAGVWRGEDKASEAIKIGIANTPFANIPYLRMALNWGAVYHINEWLNPGYLRRQEQRIKEQSGSSFWLRPSDYIKSGGGFK